MNDLSPRHLARAYAAREKHPPQVLREVYERIARRGSSPAWTHVRPYESVLRDLEFAEASIRPDARGPLFGVPFAVKDNIDVASVPTTAACPAFAFVPAEHARSVELLVAAGALCVGKTNLDQFATGLVGARSPYGACSCVFDDRYISGGSSSGSAVAVARGEVGFALGTDTAGSGRIPAAFNALVGLKPTRGLVSTRGVVPACRSLDCVSVFAETVWDAYAVLDCIAGFDERDPFSRLAPELLLNRSSHPPRLGVPRAADLEFFGDSEYARAFDRCLAALREQQVELVPIDFTPFRAAAALLYEGPWVAERWLVLRELCERDPDAIHPVVRGIVESGRKYSAAEAFSAQYRLAELKACTQPVWSQIDALLLPTAPTHYTHAEVQAAPVDTNRRLGTYTNFVNLLDLAGIAVPCGKIERGLPFGVTLIGPAFSDRMVATLASQLFPEARAGAPALLNREPELGPVKLAVVGAHLEGQPLHHELTQRRARLIGRTHTAPEYRLFALDTTPAKPGLVAVASGGHAIEVEVYELTAAAFGDFVAKVPSPMTIGNTRLADGSQVKGFACESWALEAARDITAFGGWRAYLASCPR